MTIADAEEIFAYWETSPPTHHMAQTIAAMFGWKPKSRSTRDVNVIVADAAHVGIAATSEPTPDRSAVVLDFEAMKELNRTRAHQIAKRNLAKAAG